MRRSPMWVGVLWSTLLLPGCPDEEAGCPSLVQQGDVECKVSGDCAEAGFTRLSCIDGQCRLPCTVDSDCTLFPEESEEGQGNAPAMCPPSPDAICEAQICVPACHADTDCTEGQKCLRTSTARASSPGKCGYYFESFETDLFVLGWFPIGYEDLGRLPNPRIKTAWVGVRGCDPSQGGDNCAGPPSSGERFAILETAPTPAKGTASTAPTCGACACCLECVIDPPRMNEAAPQMCSLRCEAKRADDGLNAYCGIESPAPFDECPASNPGCRGQPVCPATVPTPCVAVCNACDSCAGRADVPGNALAMCEAKAARKTCDACVACDSCGATQCPTCANDPTSLECINCLETSCLSTTACLDCYACSEGAECELAGNGSAECIANKNRCLAQGNDGCYQTPIDYPDTQLSDEEMSLVSRPITEVAGLSGSLVLEISYVPFNVGASYFVGVQGQAPPLWPSAPQQVLVQLCAGNCGQSSSWQTAKLLNGLDASIPPANARGNGLSVGLQTSLDWRDGKLRVALPESYRTPELRVRFLPQLGESVRVGIDDVMIRRGG